MLPDLHNYFSELGVKTTESVWKLIFSEFPYKR